MARSASARSTSARDTKPLSYSLGLIRCQRRFFTITVVSSRHIIGCPDSSNVSVTPSKGAIFDCFGGAIDTLDEMTPFRREEVASTGACLSASLGIFIHFPSVPCLAASIV